jgi:hypothetical protein
MKKYILTESQIRNLVNNVVDESKKGETKYTPEYLEKIKEKYKGKLLSDFRNGEDKGVYGYVIGKDYYQDFIKDMIRTGNKKCPDYSESELRDIAKKIETRNEFYQKNTCAYRASIRLGPFITSSNGKRKNTYGFYNQITSHMVVLNRASKRLIYAFEFYDENNEPAGVYVGLTYDSEKRKSAHETGINFLGKEEKTAVNKFMKDHPTFTYVYEEKTDYIDVNEAIELEKYWEKEYFMKGWNILNVAATGSLGKTGKTLKQIKKELDYVYDVEGIKTLDDLKSNKKYGKLYVWVQKWGLHDPKNEDYLLGKFKRVKSYRKTKDELMDDVKKHNSYEDFLKDENLRLLIWDRGLIYNVKDYFGEPYTDEHFINQALKFKNYNDFYYNSKYFQKSRNRNLIPKIKELFVQRELEQQNEPIEQN